MLSIQILHYNLGGIRGGRQPGPFGVGLCKSRIKYEHWNDMAQIANITPAKVPTASYFIVNRFVNNVKSAWQLFWG